MADQTGDGKKKYDSVVYKRRIGMPLAQAEQFLAEETAGQKGRLCRISPDSRQSQRSEIDRQQSIASETARETDQPVNTGIVRINPQIRNEIHYCMQNYHDLHPAVLFTYERDASHNSKTGGFGIGLSVVYAIVIAHKGKISAKSEDGKSVTFTVVL